jgi:hypothetical protein
MVYVMDSKGNFRGHRGSTVAKSATVEGVLLSVGRS